MLHTMTNSMKNNIGCCGNMYRGPELAYGGEWEDEDREDFPEVVTVQLKKQQGVASRTSRPLDEICN